MCSLDCNQSRHAFQPIEVQACDNTTSSQEDDKSRAWREELAGSVYVRTALGIQRLMQLFPGSALKSNLWYPPVVRC